MMMSFSKIKIKVTPRQFWTGALIVLLFICVAIAAWVSFTTQRGLGMLMLWPEPWGLPAIIDTLTVATLIAYVLRPDWFMRIVSTGMVAISSIANAQAHYYDPRNQELGVPLEVAIAWGVLPPLAMFGVAHCIVHVRKPPKVSKVRKQDGEGTHDQEWDGSLTPSTNGAVGSPNGATHAVTATASDVAGADTSPTASGSDTTSPSTPPTRGAGSARAVKPAARGARTGAKRTLSELSQLILDNSWDTGLTNAKVARNLVCSKADAGEALKLARSQREAREVVPAS